ncbi:VOC family protein [Psychromicrobium lacuslunae]|uniref:Glyoxalase n=1 Tax=Psychromicrobium lacuslunae TaxID=1618207 RepID=A0A0D4C2L2_9MICC|nr:glyoxalase/bleomycin resistance/dioxygenase family protein [Psychromicrobium lacuslunae]AJT42843.1 hypothetical protein UM93_03270 [Psychromicrobium lacuslunae]
MSESDSNIVEVVARVYVEDLNAALPLYQQLSGGGDPHRFGFRDIQLAKIGSFLLIQGADEEVRSHTATIAVRDISLVEAAISEAGGALLEGPTPGPNGPRLIARHPDGNIIEYIQRSNLERS